MVIFIFLVWKYPFCVNLIQKFKRAILRRNLPTAECLIDVSPLMNFSIFFTQDILFPPLPPPPPPPLWIIGESFHPEFETICWCWLFFRSRKRNDQTRVCFVLQVRAKKPKPVSNSERGTCFFCDQKGRSTTVFVQAKLVINNAPLTYV